MSKSKPKVIEVRCPGCGMPVVGRIGDRCMCGTALRSNVVFINLPRL